MMSKNDVKNIKLNLSTDISSNGMLMGEDLKSTLKLNLKRVNKSTNKYYTPTYVIFNYVKSVNNGELMGCKNKDKYLKIAKKLLKELKSCGFQIGIVWRGKNLLPYARGNKKLSRDTIIINISPSSLCVSKNNNLCELCGICYALASERRYVNTLIYRLTQLIKFDEMSVDEIISQFKNLRGVKWMRINESGDIFNISDVKKLFLIAEGLYLLKGVKTYIYTHREDLWDDIMSYQTHFFKINRSGVDFISLPSIKSHHKYLYCDGVCKYCIYCKLDLSHPISILYHGDIDGEDERDTDTKKRDLILKWECFKMWRDGCDVSEIISHISHTLSHDDPIKGEI